MKTKSALIIISCVLLVSCAQQMTDSEATNLLMSTLELSSEDKPKILGISKDSESVVQVKSVIADEIINFKFRKYDKGWRVEEVQNDLGMWVPVDSTIKLVGHWKKVLTAMKEIMLISTGLLDYLTDHGMHSPNAGPYNENSALYRAICPEYLTKMPIKDPWGNNYLVYTGEMCNGLYGLEATDEWDFVVVSYGKDARKDDWVFLENMPEAGYFLDGDGTEDLVCFSGSWVRAPRDHVH